MAHFASRVKTDWRADPAELRRHAHRIAATATKRFRSSLTAPDGLRGLSPDATRLLLAESISPLPLHRTLILLDAIDGSRRRDLCGYERLALAKVLPTGIGNLRFGPEVGITTPKSDAPVVELWLAAVDRIATDLKFVHDLATVQTRVHLGDSRELLDLIDPSSVDAVITSPPYPNEKDYTRTTRLESVLLGFLSNRASLRLSKEQLLRSNTRNVYKDDDDDEWVREHPQIQAIAAEIEARRLDLGKTSGFERLYGRTTKLYFGGMARHLERLQKVLRPGARLAYVVGDQASYLRVMIRTGQLLADLAERQGYEVEGIDLFRTRLATATREQLREEVVRLRWPG